MTVDVDGPVAVTAGASASGDLWSFVEPEAARRLLEAAVEEFAARGFHATTTRAIAERVGLSPAGLYVHFRSKHQVLVEIVRACHEAALADVKTAIASSGPTPSDQLVTAMEAWVSWHARHPMPARVAQSELRSLEEAAFRSIVVLRRALEEAVESIVVAGQRAREFDGKLEPRSTARGLLSLGIDVSRWYREGDDLSPAEIGRLYAKFGIRMVRADASELGAAAIGGEK
jgi:AcrR family transcriptional regulator